MKVLIFILLLNSTQVFGQDNPYNKIPAIADIIDRKDTFEVKFEGNTGLKQRVDTLPLFSKDEYNGWRNYQLVRYYLSNDSVVIISFRDGQRGNYFFFFEGSFLKKVRLGYPAKGKTKSYYYTISENIDPMAQTKVSFKDGRFRKDKPGLLAAGQTLKARFYELQ